MRLFLTFFFLVLSPLLDATPVTKCPFLITGCARSGTTYVYELLSQSGLRIGQEELGIDGCVAWQLACEANYNLYHLKFPRGKIEFDTVLHLVRDPIKVINSLYGRTVSPHHFVLGTCLEIHHVLLSRNSTE